MQGGVFVSGWAFAALVVLVLGAVVLYLHINVRELTFEVLRLRKRVEIERRERELWESRFEFAEQEIADLRQQLAATAPAFSADDMAFLLREASRLREPKD